MQKIGYFYLISVLFISCAQQVVPSGGSKDEKPPKILLHNPDNKSVNFKSKEIILKFDEYISIKDPGQIIISPFLKDKPKIESKGKQISIAFLKGYPEMNTTYTINFANAIVDVNEGNALNNYSYVFSTGNYLDSNSIKGKIYNAQSTKEEKEILIALYKTNSFTDTTIYKKYPDYLTKSNEQGRFSINNLPADTFYLIAFKDANADNKYQKIEEIAFYAEQIIPTTISDSIKLTLFKNPLHKPNTLLDTLSKQKHVYQFVVYNPTHIDIKSLKHKASYQKLNTGKNNIDTIHVFVPQSIDTSAEAFEIKTIDSVYTVRLRTKAKSKLIPFQASIIIPDKPTDSIRLISNTPIVNIDKSRIEILEDTTQITLSYFKEISPFEWVMYYPYKETKPYTITIKDSALLDIFSRYNVKTNNSFINKSEKEYGTMLLNINANTNQKIILQLIESQANDELVIQTWKYPLPKETQIRYLKPGNYQFKVIEDINNNGVWDTGNYSQKIQPEPIYYDKTVISIKAYWDIEQSISIDNIINN